MCGKASIDGLTHPRCQGRFTIDGCFAIVQYKGLVKKLMYTYKYKPYLSDLYTFLTDLFYEGMIQHELLYKKLEKGILTPIPLHPSRLRARGYDQVGLLTEAIAKRTRLPVSHLLKRVKKTDSQFGLKREERIRNIKDAFAVLPDKNHTDKTILIVDDIVTSGTTLAEAARVLKREGYRKVYGLAFAHGQ
jgi:ComF family protein